MVSGYLFPKLKVTTLLIAGLAGPVKAAEINLCWKGAGGFTMTGRMSLPDDAMYRAIVTEDDVTAFKISGYHKGQLIGTWDKRQAQVATTFHLRFDPAGMTFLTGGSFPSTASQGWNADGTSANCGTPGFGFNAGNFGQDFCLNGEWIEASSIAPDTAFFATLDPVTPDCRNTAAVSKQ